MKDHFSEHIKKIEATIGYEFRDPSLLAQAFTRSSFCNEQNRDGVKYQSNEILEFFGDSVLSAAVITYLINERTERYVHGVRSELSEGEFSNVKSRLCDKKSLSGAIDRLGLQKYLRLGEGDRKLGIAEEPSVKEDLFESIIGAVFIDSNKDMNAVSAVVSKILRAEELINEKPPAQSAKNSLQEWCDSKLHRLPHPTYATISESGPDHKKEYERGCYIGERLVASARGKNMKLADAAAAERALEVLKREAAQKHAKDNKSLQNKRASAPKKADKTQHGGGLNAKKGRIPSVSAEEAERAYASLRGYAERNKCASVHYRDLGECDYFGERIHKISCEMAGVRAEGAGCDRQSARAAAAVALAKALKTKTK